MPSVMGLLEERERAARQHVEALQAELREADPAPPLPPGRGPRAPGADRAARPLPPDVRPRAGAHAWCPPVPAGVQQLACDRQVDEGRHGGGGGRARAGLRRRGPRRTGRPPFPRHGHRRGVTAHSGVVEHGVACRKICPHGYANEPRTVNGPV